MAPEHLQIVTSTATVVEARRDDFAVAFLDRLFEVAPSTRSLFPDDLGDEGGKLVDELVSLARVAGDFAGFVHRARQIGARHRRHGARSTDYAAVGDALLVALADVLGDECTSDVVRAWTRLYQLMSETIMEGACSGLFCDG